MLVTRIFSKLKSPRLLQNPRYNFFFNKTTPKLDFDPEIKEDLVHEKKYLSFLKTLANFPLEIGKEYHSEKKPVNIFSQSAYLSVMASEEFREWTEIFKLFYRGLETGNFGLFDGKVEKNLYERVEKFHRELKGTDLSLELPEVKEPIYKVHIVKHRTYKGVFIDRALNFPLSNYYHKETANTETYEVLAEKVLGKEKASLKVDWDDVLDKDLSEEYLEKDRSGYTVNQFTLEIETNMKMFLAKEESGGKSRPVYGNIGEGFESHYIVIENKRDYFKKHPYYIVDFDFVLKKNPHVQGR